MAVMIPSDGGYFDPSSGEQKMFEALKNNLPNDYYVFHSYRLVQYIPDKGLNENEIDFLIFHPNYGCLFIECKNSRIDRDGDGNWSYINNENGIIKAIPMKDPFDQAFSGQHNLFNKLKDTYPEYRDKLNKCKFMVGVWLPKYSKREIREACFGPNIAKELIISKEALLQKEETLAQIQFLMERMNKVHLVCKYEEKKVIEDASGYKQNLSHEEAMLLYRKVLCPTFRAIVNLQNDYERTYIELLEEQYIILDFLAYQRTAAISGASGTGKTLVAVERARRLSDKGDKVLFLCYNRNLMDVLEKTNKPDLGYVDFYTLDAFGCKKCNTSLNSLSYFDLKAVIKNEILDGTFEYKHIIVDEGQDFGRRSDSESEIKSEILKLLSDYGEGIYNNDDTSFFVFYDKNQLVNSKQMPQYLQDVDSKLTLYKNCRNTKNIALTAYSLIDLKPNVFDRTWVGETTEFIIYSDNEDMQKKLDIVIDSLQPSEDTVIISCSKSITYSAVFHKTYINYDNRNYIYNSGGKKTKIFTCPTFKGLEADNVIVIDIGNEIFENDNCDFYVASSRAKKKLFVFFDKYRLKYDNIIQQRFPSSFKLKDKTRQLILAMHGIPK